MSHRRDLEHHRHSLGEIREILNSMKTLAYMETRKLDRFLPAQEAMVASIEEVAEDFLHFHPGLPPEEDDGTPLFLLIGSERGFCGDFNHALLERLADTPAAEGNGRLLVIGRKLHPLLEGDDRVAAVIDGASVVEEIPVVLQQVVTELAALQDAGGGLALYGLYHGDDGIVIDKLLPPFRRQAHAAVSQRYPPLLNLSPQDFLLDLIDHYLFAALNRMLYTALMVENSRRVTHLEGAVQHLDEESADLSRQCNALRQEEIIEEIEVILLSAASLEQGPAPLGRSGRQNK